MLLEDAGSVIFIVVIHHTRLLEVLLQVVQALKAPVLDVTSLFRVEFLPSSIVEFVEEIEDEEVVHKVDEGVAHVGRVLEVDGEIEEIVLPLVALVDLLE